MLSNATNFQLLSRLRSAQRKEAGPWIPQLQHQMSLPFNLAIFAWRLVSGLDCRYHFSTGHYLWLWFCYWQAWISPAYFGGTTWAHDSIVSSWSSCLREVGILHKRETCHRYVGSNGKPDIVILDSAALSNAELEVFLAYPGSELTIRRAQELMVMQLHWRKT